MDQAFIPAIFMRGGSSKGVFFHKRDLPTDRAVQDAIFLSVLGSPDPYGRQLDGMGGGISSLSKAVIIGPPTHPDADVDYLFAQVAVDKPIVDWSSNCGNLSSAVGPFAVDEGLVRVADGEALVRIHQVNTKRIIHARFPVQGGKAVTAGDFTMAGVSGSGARIRLDFLAPGGGATGRTLPSGQPADLLHHDGRIYAPSTIEFPTASHFLEATAPSLTGKATPHTLEDIPSCLWGVVGCGGHDVQGGSGIVLGFFEAEEGIRASPESRGRGGGYKRQASESGADSSPTGRRAACQAGGLSHCRIRVIQGWSQPCHGGPAQFPNHRDPLEVPLSIHI